MFDAARWKFLKKSSGFTLVELLIVIAIVATLAVAVSVALNPSKRLKDSKDARRTADVDSILTAIHSSIVDNKGTAPTNLGTLEKQLGTAATGCAVSTGGCTVTAVDCADLMTGTQNLSKYLKAMTKDPEGGTDALTKYSAVQNSDGIVTVRACGVEGSVNISASR